VSVETVPSNVVQLHPPIDPCPFCGDKGPELEDDEFDHSSHASGPVEYWVKCGCCGARGPEARVGCRDDEEEEIDLELEAITMWNTRGEHLEDEDP
jgi:hypothetical protein